MKAVRFDEYGGVDVLKVVDVPRPVPGTAQVLVQVMAAGINPGEAKIRVGLEDSSWPATFPSRRRSRSTGSRTPTGDSRRATFSARSSCCLRRRRERTVMVRARCCRVPARRGALSRHALPAACLRGTRRRPWSSSATSCTPCRTCSSTPIAAIANAVWHATGVRYRTLPLTPDRVLRACPRPAAGRRPGASPSAPRTPRPPPRQAHQEKHFVVVASIGPMKRRFRRKAARAALRS